MVEVHGLQKRYGDVAAESDVSFTAPDGRITAVLGANGAGKTTTLGMICGVLRPEPARFVLTVPRHRPSARAADVWARFSTIAVSTRD